MSNLTNEGQKYETERAWRGGAAVPRFLLGLTSAALSKTSVLADVLATEPLGVIAAPGAPSAALAGAGAGVLSNGAYKYKVVYEMADGETEAGTVSGTVTVVDYTTNGKINLTAIPVGPLGVTARRLYRTVAAGSVYKLLATLADNTTTTYADNIADGSLGVDAPAVNSTGQKAPPGAPTAALAGAGAGVLSNGAYSYKITFVSSVGETEGGTTSATVTVADYTTNGQVALTAIPLGPYGVTSRKIYRTAVGGTQHKLVATLANNTATTYTDNIADGSLGADVPAENNTAPNGYKRQTLTQDSTGFPTSALDAGDWQITSKNFVYTANGGTIGPVNKVFLTDLASGSTGGKLYSWWDLSASRTMTNTETLTWSGKFKKK